MYQSRLIDELSALSREQLKALQLSKLQRQIARLYETNVFYRERFDAAGVKPGQIRSLEDFSARVPTMGKPDCIADQNAHPPFGRRVGVPREDVMMINLTGGTSGQGQEAFGRTNADIAMQGHFHHLPWHLAGLRRGDAALNCVPAGGLTTGGWGPTEGFRVAGATAYAAGGVMSTDAKIDLMLRFGTFHFIYASTSYMHTLTEAFRRRGVNPKTAFPMLKSLFVAAEGYPVEWAQRTEEFWGAKLHEGYGSTQAAGFCGGTCEHGAISNGGRGNIHIFEWHNVVEVLDPATGTPVAEGEEGEVVLTNLDIIGSPVVRFRTGDKVRYMGRGRCGCGRSWLAVEAGTIGRLDDMMKIRGNNMWPSAVDAVVFRDESVWEYAGRVFVTGSGKTGVELRIALKPDAGISEGAERENFTRKLKADLKSATNINMDIAFVDRSELPNYDYKSRRWKDERSDGFRSGAISE